MKRNTIITLIGGISIMVAAFILGFSLYKTKGPVKTISVVGLAEKDFVSDLIVWNLGFDLLDPDLKAGYSKIKAQNEIIKEYLIGKNIPEEEIIFNATSAYEDYRYEWDAKNSRSVQLFNGYKLSQSIRIESREVEKIEKVAREISELLDEGININTYSPEYYYTKLADLKIEMLANASVDARLRAETIAANAGAKISGLKTANMGVFQITAPNSSEESYTWGGAFNTNSKNKRASINMRLTYLIK